MYRHALFFGFLLTVIVTASCVRAPVERVEWPEDLPPIDYYERVYASDPENQAVQSREEYFKWVVRFYRGWKLYQDGWDATTRDLLHGIEDGASRERMRRKMARLGRIVSGEWAKSAGNRRIRSRELSVWGQALLKSLNNGEEEKLIDRVTRDATSLLEGSLDPIDIQLRRY
jgi:hypothetical protein